MKKYLLRRLNEAQFHTFDDHQRACSAFPVVRHSGEKRRTTYLRDEGTIHTNCFLLGHHDDTPSLVINCADLSAKCLGCGAEMPNVYITMMSTIIEEERLHLE